jgi:hypothetical protein
MYGAGKEESILDGEITYIYFDSRDFSLPIIRGRLKILYDYLTKTIIRIMLALILFLCVFLLFY